VIDDSTEWLWRGVDKLVWRKSTFSTTGECVAVAELGNEIALRNSNDPAGAMLPFDRAELGCWIEGIKAGEFDDLAS
jgi:hypothetical protein